MNTEFMDEIVSISPCGRKEALRRLAVLELSLYRQHPWLDEEPYELQNVFIRREYVRLGMGEVYDA